MAVLTIFTRNGPRGTSNPRDDTFRIYLNLDGSHDLGEVMVWTQNYRPSWKSKWAMTRMT